MALSPDPAHLLCLCGLWTKSDFTFFKWLGAGQGIESMQKLYETQISICINKVLLGHSLIHSLGAVCGRSYIMEAELHQRSGSPQSLKYLIFGSLQKKNLLTLILEASVIPGFTFGSMIQLELGFVLEWDRGQVSLIFFQWLFELRGWLGDTHVTRVQPCFWNVAKSPSFLPSPRNCAPPPCPGPAEDQSRPSPLSLLEAEAMAASEMAVFNPCGFSQIT